MIETLSSHIQTFTGCLIDPLNADIDQVSIADIAHSLSNQCRYTGHTAWHYSVAQHSVLVSREVMRRVNNTNIALAALLHDASEAYLIDVPRPLKHSELFAGYREAEDKLQKAINLRYCVSGWSEDTTIKDVDYAMLPWEITSLFGDYSGNYGPVTIQPPILRLTPEQAEKMFLSEFLRLN